MKARPILFSAPMIRALLEGRKTQTRRVVKPQPIMRGEDDCVIEYGKQRHSGPASYLLGRVLPTYGCPYGVIGDVLRVKEAAWMWCERRPNGVTKLGRQKWHYVPLQSAPIFYATEHPQCPLGQIVSPDTGNKWQWRHKVARFMPSWASRLTLRITDVRVERLQDISEIDAINEGVLSLGEEWFRRTFPISHENHQRAIKDGVKPPIGPTPAERYFALWQQINGSSGATNPWVWALTFDVIQQNVDEVLKAAA